MNALWVVVVANSTWATFKTAPNLLVVAPAKLIRGSLPLLFFYYSASHTLGNAHSMIDNI